MTIFSAPVNPERPKGQATCAKCAHLRTWPTVHCIAGGPLEPCDRFKDASVDRTVRRSLKGAFMWPRPA